jgi:trans-2,3-dihydro-3-hydroxyanthranilate isomerase
MTRFVTLDVFTDRRFAGNPLAVVPDARGIAPEDFQRLAREFAYSETTFVLPPDDPSNDARVRIFTPAEEMPFAGHPNVGTAIALALEGHVLGKPVGILLRFEEIAGLVEVRLEKGPPLSAEVRAPAPLQLGPERTPAQVAALAGLMPKAILTASHPPRYASVGTGFLFAEVEEDLLDTARPDGAAFEAERARLGGSGFGRALPALFLWTKGAAEPGSLAVRARMFAPLSGVPEDPATGSAAAALGAFLQSLGIADRLAITQGEAMGRPSLIRVRSSEEGTWIAGGALPMFEGRIL